MHVSSMFRVLRRITGSLRSSACAGASSTVVGGSNRGRLHRLGNAAEGVLQLRSEARHSSGDRARDACCDESVFYGRRSRLVF